MGGRTFADERDRLRRALSELAGLAADRGSPKAAEAARDLDAKLAGNRFNVVVLGEFKRGKTTFVNALLGAEVLPAAVVPLTSVVTAVTWGEEVRARVAYHDGREEEVRVQDLPRFVTERDNPGNRLGVANAFLSFPAEELRDGVFLVDTPGVGSVYRHNTDAARAFLPEADVAILLTSADPPISDAERSFLEEVRDEAARMFFVLNKADYLTGIDRDEAIAFTRGVIVDAVGHDVPLYPMSAKQALIAKLVGDQEELEASGLPAFERDLRAFLLHEKGRAILDSVSSRALRLVDAERNSIDVQERALELSERELEEVGRRMEEVFVRARTAQRDVQALLRNEVQELVSILEEDLEVLRNDEERRLLALGREHLSAREDPSHAAGEVDRLVKDGLRVDLERWRSAEERKLVSAFREATVRFVEQAGATERETVRLCGEILGIELASELVPVDLSPETRFSFDFFEVPTILESILPDVRRFLPRGTGRRLLERDLARRVPQLVDKHCGRLRYDFVSRLEDARRRLERTLDQRLDATIEGLRGGIRRSELDRRRSAEEADRARQANAATRSRLEDLRRAFASATSRAGEARR